MNMSIVERRWLKFDTLPFLTIFVQKWPFHNWTHIFLIFFLSMPICLKQIFFLFFLPWFLSIRLRSIFVIFITLIILHPIGIVQLILIRIKQIRLVALSFGYVLLLKPIRRLVFIFLHLYLRFIFKWPVRIITVLIFLFLPSFPLNIPPSISTSFLLFSVRMFFSSSIIILMQTIIVSIFSRIFLNLPHLLMIVAFLHRTVPVIIVQLAVHFVLYLSVFFSVYFW